jgi:phospholipid transport system transporter-binding protein
MTTALPASLTIKDARAAVAALRAGIVAGSGPVAIDAGALKTFDTSAIAALLELRREAGARPLVVTGAPPAMVELAGLYGVAELLDFQSARA